MTFILKLVVTPPKMREKDGKGREMRLSKLSMLIYKYNSFFQLKFLREKYHIKARRQFIYMFSLPQIPYPLIKTKLI